MGPDPINNVSTTELRWQFIQLITNKKTPIWIRTIIKTYIPVKWKRMNKPSQLYGLLLEGDARCNLIAFLVGFMRD
jgi:hypothetical protein